MNTKAKDFLIAILGADGANALIKAGERDPSLNTIVLPRAIISWLSFASTTSYEGEIPGTPDSYLEFYKTAEDSFNGALTVGEDTYSFNKMPLLHVAAATAVALEADTTKIDPQLQDANIAKLGKNIDLLIGSRYLNLLRKSQKIEESSVEKKEAIGGSAEPTVATDMEAPVPPVPKQPLVTQHRLPTIKVTKSQASRPCVVCDRPQFTDGKPTLCFCLKDLAKSTKAVETKTGYTITFGENWSKDDIGVFLDMVGEDNG